MFTSLVLLFTPSKMTGTLAVFVAILKFRLLRIKSTGKPYVISDWKL